MTARDDAAPVLSVRDLRIQTRARRPVPILQEVSFDVYPGETVCLVGEYGSGKSVAALAVMDLLPRGALQVTGGHVLFNGENILTASRQRIRALRGAAMAMIFQEPMTALNPVLSIGRQMDEVYRAHTRMRAAERKAAAMAAWDAVQLPNPARIHASFPHQLSGEQRQRVMIAMAWALRPQLLIADEPTTALDLTTQRQILALIRTLQAEQGTAVLFTTHDMGLVSDIADRVCVMHRGCVEESGSVEDVLARPRTTSTKALLRAALSLSPRMARPETARQTVLEVTGLHKRFDTRALTSRLLRRPGHPIYAVRDVHLILQRGRALGIVGESGSGKSTVARCIVRLEDPSEGHILVHGQDIARLRQARELAKTRSAVQMVFQDPNRSLNPRWPVLDSLIEGPLNAGVDRASAVSRAGELLETVGVPRDTLKSFPHQLSGGQRQRIAIACALMMDPDVIIADEIVSALDVSLQAQVLTLLADIQRRYNLAVLFMTHDLRVAAHVCDEILIMQHGQIVERGATADIVSAPQHPYTRALLDAVPGRNWDFAQGRRMAGA